MQNKIRNSVCTDLVNAKIDARGFIKICLIDSKADFDLTEAKRQHQLITDLVDNQKFLALIDTRKSFSVPTIEAKKYLANVEKKIAEAILVNSLGNRILGNLYIKIINKRYPSKLFSDEQKAIDWLLSHKK